MYLARTGFARNTAYNWSVMINNVASALFGFIYIALWQSVAPTSSSATPYTRATMTTMVVLAQVLAWVATFLPAGLGIQNMVRSGSIALEMARPVPFLPMILVREAGNLVYQGLFRSLPLAVLFAVTVGFPAPASFGRLLLTVPSVLLASYTALTMVYLVGISALWTTEIRWAHSLYYTLTTLLSGGWIPADLLPGWLGKVAPYSPFACTQFHPLRIYLGMVGPWVIGVQVGWAIVLTAVCLSVTRKAMSRVSVQGG